MNPEIKADWIAALRSGKYAQGRGRLNINDTEFCCLGVLCELAVERGITARTLTNDIKGTVRYLDAEGYTRASLLPSTVMFWAGLEDVNPRVKDVTSNSITSLAELNDFGYSFEDIANIIEAQL